MKTKQVQEFKEAILGEQIIIIIDHRGVTPKKLGGDWTDYGIPVISAKNIKNKKLSRLEEIRFISRKMADRWMPIKLQKNDVLITSEGATLGEVAILKQEEDYCIGQRLFAVRCNSKLLDPYYLYYYLISDKGQNEIFTKATGSTVEGLRQYEVRNILLSLPLIDTQKNIGGILKILDGKIENLQKQNKILEQIIKSIFKSWFVDFDGQTELIDSELGQIPKGWQVIDLKNSLSLLKDGSHNPPKRVESGIRFIAGATDVKHFVIDFSKCTFITQKDYEEIHKTWQIQSQDILLTIVGTIGNVAIVKDEDLPFSLQRSLAVLRSNEQMDFVFLYCLLNSNEFEQYLYSTLNPTGQPGIYLGTLGGFQFVLPPKPLIENFFKLSYPIVSNIQKNYLNMNCLSKIRDSLLPKLMSGEIRV